MIGDRSVQIGKNKRGGKNPIQKLYRNYMKKKQNKRIMKEEKSNVKQIE